MSEGIVLFKRAVQYPINSVLVYFVDPKTNSAQSSQSSKRFRKTDFIRYVIKSHKVRPVKSSKPFN